MIKKLLNFHLVVFALFYFLTRLINISKFPIFTDEAIYSYWAQVALHDPSNRYMSLEDGKQPLFIWLGAIAQNFLNDPLIAMRLISVLAGFGTLVGIYLLAKSLTDHKTAILSSALYLVLPFSLLYDRLALYDSLLTMFIVYATYFIVKLAKRPSLSTSLLTGLTLGLGLMTKSSANFFLYLMPVSLLLFDVKNKNHLVSRLSKFAAFGFIAALISQIIYNSLRYKLISGSLEKTLFYMISRKNLEFIRTLPEVIKDPFAHFYSNIHAILSWLITYISPPLFALFLLGLTLAYFKKNLSLIYLSVLIFTPFISEALFNKVLYPRFIFFYFPFVIILISYAAIWLLEKFKKFELQLKIVFALIIFIPLTTSFKILTNPAYAKIADSDSGQYLNGWPAGYGVSQARDFLKTQSQDKDIYIGTEGTFGLLPFALDIYFYSNQKIHITGFWPVDSNNLPQQILELSKTNKTYFIFNENQKEITNPNLKLIEKYQKGKTDSYLRLYEVTPK